MTLLDGAIASVTEKVTGEAPPMPDQWLIAKNGRNFVKLPGVKGWSGMVWREGNETVAEAIERKRAQGPAKGDKTPRSRKQRKVEERPPVTPEDKSETTRQIREMMEDILCAPAMPCAGFGFDWEAKHFEIQGQRFADNIARASERNPWLRKKLEAGVGGEQTVIAWLTSLNLATGAIGYVLPPLIKWGIVPAPDMTKQLFGVPVARPLPPRPPMQPYQPPVTDAMQAAAEMWANMEGVQNTAGPPTMDTEPEHANTTDESVS